MHPLVNSNQGLVLINPYIGPLSASTTPDQNGPERDGNEGVLSIPQNSSITWTSPSDYLLLYTGHSLWGGVLPLCRGAVGVFNSSSLLCKTILRQPVFALDMSTWDPRTVSKLQGVSIYMGSMWMPSISAHSVYVYEQGVSLYMGHMLQLIKQLLILFLLTQYIYIDIHTHSVFQYIHGTHVTARLFLLTQYMCIYWLSQYKHGTHVIALLFLLTQHMYIYRVSQYIQGTHVISLLFILTQYMYYTGCLIVYMGPMWLPNYFCSLSVYVHIQGV